MQHESVESWLNYARSDLALARVPTTNEIMLETLCFHAQQAVEKSIKAVLIYHDIAFPKIHSIERLINMLPESVEKTDDLMESAQLSAYATTFRYPGIEEPVSESEYKEAIRLAESVLMWAEKIIYKNCGN